MTLRTGTPDGINVANTLAILGTIAKKFSTGLHLDAATQKYETTLTAPVANNNNRMQVKLDTTSSITSQIPVFTATPAPQKSPDMTETLTAQFRVGAQEKTRDPRPQQLVRQFRDTMLTTKPTVPVTATTTAKSHIRLVYAKPRCQL